MTAERVPEANIMKWKNSFTGLLAAAIISLPTAVAAQSAEVEAKVSFDEGKSLFAKGEYTAAAERFREAYRINPSWKLLYNIGQAEASAKRYGLALEAFESYLLEGGDELSPGRQEEIIKETTRLRAFVGMLDIRCVDGVEIVVEDVVRGTTPLPGLIPVSAGKSHEVRAIVNGEVVATKAARVMVGQTLLVELSVTPVVEEPVVEAPAATEPVAPQTAPSPQTRTDSGKGLRIAGWITAGIGAGLLIGSGVTGGIALKKNSDIKDNCPDGTCPVGEGWDDEIQSRDALGIATTVMMGVGGAALVAGTVMIIVGYKKGGKETVRLSPQFAPSYAGASLDWRF